MKIKAFSFERDSFTTADIKKSVLDCLTDGGVYFESIKDPNLLFEKLAAAVREQEVILLGVETQLYLKFKPVLIKAFHFTPAFSEAIGERLGDEVTDETLRKAHMLVPNESTELLTENGQFSGFYVKSDSQYIVVFPLSDEVVPAIFIDKNLPFILKHENKEEVYNAINSATASAKAAALISKLAENDLKLSIPSTPAAEVLKADIRAVAGSEERVFFTPFVNDVGVEDPKEYASQLARGAMELRSADLGATISGVFRKKEGDKVLELYTFIAVAAKGKAIVRKLYADTDEEIAKLLTEATNELYSLIDKYSDEVIFKKNATKEELEQFERAKIEEEFKADVRPAASLGKKGIIAAIVILAAALIICIALGFKFGGYFVDAGDEPEDTSLITGDSLPIEIPSTTLPAPTESDTITEFTSEPESSTTLPPITANIIYTSDTYIPDTERTTQRVTETTTKKPTTTAKSTETTIRTNEFN